MPAKSRPQTRRISPAEAQTRLLDLVRQRRTIADALVVIGRSRWWYEDRRRKDPAFAAEVDAAREITSTLIRNRRAVRMPFSEFSEQYLFQKVWPHMGNAVDLLEGREPSWLHPSMIYEPGTSGKSRLLINVPPNHAKTVTLTMNYVTYRLAMDPTINVIVISKTLDLAKKFVYGVKKRLTHPAYAQLQIEYGPPDGWRATADQWTQTKIYLGGEDSSATSKDPTLEALGMGGQIYGSRADLIILDDVVTLSNSAEWPAQLSWLRQEVASRLPPSGGELLIVGTRVAPVDLYKELRNPEHYSNGRVPYTYLAMPAVLEYADSPSDWVTLWPRSEEPEEPGQEPDADGFYPRWSGPRLAEVRNEAGPSMWSLVYQNLDVAEDAIFHPACVKGAVNAMRKPGPLIATAVGHPEHPEGFYRVIGLDPAMSGDTAAVAYAVDRRTGKRYVMDVHVITAPSPQAIRSLLQEWADRYRPNTVIVESNAFQLFLTKDEQIREFLASRGISYRPHHTGNNKTDPDFGVASLSPLFGSLASDGKGVSRHAKDNLIELPDTSRFEGPRKLVEQLITWQPGKPGSKLKQDAVMALWFCEIVAREIVHGAANAQNFYESEFTSEWDRQNRYVIDLDLLDAQELSGVQYA